MNILILGSGGRELALAWAVKQNPKCDRLIVALDLAVGDEPSTKHGAPFFHNRSLGHAPAGQRRPHWAVL